MKTVIVDKFKLREYQKPIWRALESIGTSKIKRLVIVLARRAGKDILVWNWLIKRAIMRPGIYFYLFPTFTMGRRVLFDTLTMDGLRFLDFLPREAVESINITQMKITLRNKSIISVLGSDNADSLVGTNPSGCIFSEYALQDPKGFQLLTPALRANGGFAIFISTPRGHNHFHELWKIAEQNKESWYSIRLTVDDTHHIPLEEIQEDIDQGRMSWELSRQEYWVDWDLGIEGSYYCKYIDKMKLQGRIGIVPFEPNFKVHSSWDLGVHDATCICLFQTVNNTVRIINYYANTDKGLDHYVQKLQDLARSEGYVYGRHFAPHDIKVRELGSTGGLSRLESARNLGINFDIVPNLSIDDGIEATKAALGSKIWIDEVKCAPLIKALENYRRIFDAKLNKHRDHPLHDWASDPADSFRYLCLSIPSCSDESSPEELERRYQTARMGKDNNLPRFFRDDIPNNY